MASSDTIMTTNPSTGNTVRARRTAAGLSQAELAQQAGISRTAISAIESCRLSPAVTTAISLARILGCTVEELFGPAEPAAEARWAWTPPPGRWRYWQAEIGGRTLLLPIEQTESSAEPHDGVCDAPGGVPAESAFARQTLVVATCDPAASLLAAEYRKKTDLRMLVIQRSSQAALELLRQGACHVAGVHFSSDHDADANSRRIRETLPGDFDLIRAARWEAGLSIGSGVSSRSVRGIVQSRPHWVGREEGAAARRCLDRLIGARQTVEHVAANHRGVAEAIRSGWADAGVCVRLVSDEARLRFLPIQSESYDLCVPRALESDARIRQLLALLQSTDYRRKLAELPGYDSRETGEVHPV